MRDSYFGSLIRYRVYFITIVVFFGVLSFQLFKMQILNYDIYSKQANKNSIKKIEFEAPRGIFYDRNSDILLSNKSQFTFRIVPAYYDTNNNKLLETALELEEGTIKKILDKNKRYSKFLPVKIKKGASFKSVAWYDENSDFLKGIDYIVETIRDYSFGVNASHTFGYIKEISADLIKRTKGNYSPGDYIGYNGLEKEYERYLRGEKGFNFVLVNSRRQTVGKYLNGSLDKKPEKGADLILSIDKNTQITAERLFGNYRGAAVAVVPKTGEILALVSAPQFDLDTLSNVISQRTWNKLVNDPGKPLFNRTINSVIPSGSTIKMLEGIIALNEGLITPRYSIICRGGMQFGNRFFKCHGVHGRVNLESAIEHSCNTYFYNLIFKIGLDRWHDYLTRFGFGKKTGIDLPAESKGIVPNKEYYDKLYGEGKWTDGLLMNLGIGQGEFGVTMIQMAQYAALLANFGRTRTPHLVKSFIDPKTKKIIDFNYKEISTGIDEKYFSVVRSGMYNVVQGEGTATSIRLPDITIAGKTGTSQNPHGKDHSLFIGFAPYENPKIAVAVIVENVGFGSTFAAPIARDIIKAYLRGKRGK